MESFFSVVDSTLPFVFENSGRMGVVGRYNLEIAELYYKSLKENGLTVDMVQVDDE